MYLSIIYVYETEDKCSILKSYDVSCLGLIMTKNQKKETDLNNINKNAKLNSYKKNRNSLLEIQEMLIFH